MESPKNNQPNNWQQTSSKVVYSNQWISVREDQVIHPDGKPGIYSVVDKSTPSVMIVALNDNDEILCIQLTRYPIGKPSIEIPAGAADGDDLLAAAQRELQEETGYTAKSWLHVGPYAAIPGPMSTWCHVFVARDLVLTDTNSQQEEGIFATSFYSYQEIIQLIKQEKIFDAQVITGLTMAAIHLNWMCVSRLITV